MTLKEQMARDLESVFFNLDKFGSEHEIDGRTVTVIVDEDELTQRRIQSGGALKEAGLYDCDILFFARENDLAPPPVDSILRFDGRLYMVTTSGVQDGMVTVALKGRGV